MISRGCGKYIGENNSRKNSGKIMSKKAGGSLSSDPAIVLIAGSRVR
jgi:hypothetical protein